MFTMYIPNKNLYFKPCTKQARSMMHTSHQLRCHAHSNFFFTKICDFFLLKLIKNITITKKEPTNQTNKQTLRSRCRKFPIFRARIEMAHKYTCTHVSIYHGFLGCDHIFLYPKAHQNASKLSKMLL